MTSLHLMGHCLQTAEAPLTRNRSISAACAARLLASWEGLGLDVEHVGAGACDDRYCDNPHSNQS